MGNGIGSLVAELIWDGLVMLGCLIVGSTAALVIYSIYALVVRFSTCFNARTPEEPGVPIQSQVREERR